MHQCSNFFNEIYFWYFWHFHSRNSLARTTWTLTFLWEKFGTWRNKICLCDFFACKKTFILYWVELLLVAVRINGYEPELHWTCNQMFCRLVVTMANKQIVKQIKNLVVEPTNNCERVRFWIWELSENNKNRSKLKLFFLLFYCCKLVHSWWQVICFL